MSLNNKGQSLIGIIIVLVMVVLFGGGLYYYLSKQIPEIPEIAEKPAEEEIVKLEEEAITPPEKKLPEEKVAPEEKIEEKPVVQKCADGTLDMQCSITKPLYCQNFKLVNACMTCGCPEGTSCQNDGECRSIRTTCLKSGVCVNEKILLIVQKKGGPFVYGIGYERKTVDEKITKFYSQNVDEEADFLIVFKDFVTFPEYKYFFPIKRNILGINRKAFDSSDLYGTKGGLKGFIGMGNIMELRESKDLFENALVTLAHEIGHYWLVYLDDPRLNLTYKDPNATIIGIHYASCFQPGPGGYSDPMAQIPTDWRQVNENTFVSSLTHWNTRNSRFTPLSLYLMGLIPAESVSPMFLIKPLDGSNDCAAWGKAADEMRGTGIKKEVTIEDIIRIYGKRVPDYRDSQKDFKIQFALVVHENSDLRQEDVNKFQEFINEFQNYFNFATFNNARVDVIPFE